MRNIAQYPVTTQEKLDLLQKLYDEALGDGSIGGMEPLLLAEIMHDVRSARNAPKDQFGRHVSGTLHG